MELYFAPLEGITGAEFRRAHHQYFGGVDQYYAPFISPTADHLFTPREKRNLFPEHNVGIPLVPQLLTKNADDFTCALLFRSIVRLPQNQHNLEGRQSVWIR